MPQYSDRDMYNGAIFGSWGWVKAYGQSQECGWMLHLGTNSFSLSSYDPRILRLALHFLSIWKGLGTPKE